MNKQNIKYQIILSLFLLMFSFAGVAKNYYVDANNGSNSNNGLSESTAFAALWKASGFTVAGDTVFVMDGTYTNTGSSPVVTETSSGEPSKWIVWMNYPGHNPVISLTGWQGFYIKGSYVELNGLTVKGNNENVTLEEALNQPKSCANPEGSYDARYNGNGIYVDGRSNPRVHHITVKNCTVRDCGGGGIAIIQTDYLTLENNVVFNNAWYSLFANSGISMYQNWNSDDETGVKNIIRNNICYGNRQFIPWPGYQCKFTDGNGIIIDDSENTQSGSTLGSYKGRTLIENNIVYNNGGSGVHTFKSKHVDIVNNTAYLNSQSPEINDGQIFPNASDDIRIFNNILVAPTNKKINSNYSNGKSIVYDYNLHYGGTSAALKGDHTITADPLLVGFKEGEIRLESGSPAIDAGVASMINSFAPDVDIYGNERPIGDAHDIGATEFDGATGLNDPSIDSGNSIFKIYPNPTSQNVSIDVSLNFDDKVQLGIINQTGQMVLSKDFIASKSGVNTFQISTNTSDGLYFIRLKKGDEIKTKPLIIQ